MRESPSVAVSRRYPAGISGHSQVTFERYYRAPRTATTTSVFSVTKSVVSALVGIAIAGWRSADASRLQQ